MQVTEALNMAESAAHDVPYALLQKLLHAAPTLDAIRQAVACDKGNVSISRLGDDSSVYM